MTKMFYNFCSDLHRSR